MNQITEKEREFIENKPKMTTKNNSSFAYKAILSK